MPSVAQVVSMSAYAPSCRAYGAAICSASARCFSRLRVVRALAVAVADAGIVRMVTVLGDLRINLAFPVPPLNEFTAIPNMQ